MSDTWYALVESVCMYRCHSGGYFYFSSAGKIYYGDVHG